MARATQFGPSIRQKFAVGFWAVCTKNRKCVVWECRGCIRDRVRRNAAKPCDACVCGISTNISVRRKQQYSFSASQPQHPCCCVACRPPRRGVQSFERQSCEYPRQITLTAQIYTIDFQFSRITDKIGHIYIQVSGSIIYALGQR